MLNTVGYYAEFIKLCETGNLFEAADELYLSESCLLKHMHLLNEDIGHELFSKCSKQVELTEYGALYLSFAYNMKSICKDFDAKLTELEIKNSSIVKLAIARTMNCDHIVNMLSDHFQDRYPKYSISPGEFSRTVTLPQAFHMGYELVFAVDSTQASDDYCLFPWSSDRLVAILPLSHPLSHHKSVNLSELSNDKFILFPEGSFLYKYSLELCRNAGFEPQVDFTIHGTNNLAELVSAGIGVSLTTASDIMAIKQHRVAMVEITPTPPVYLNLYYQKDPPLSKPAAVFLDYAIEIHDTHSNDIPYHGPEGEVGNVYFE